MAREHVFPYGVSQSIGLRISLLVGQEEDDTKEDSVDNDLLQHGLHFNLHQPVLPRFLKLFRVGRLEFGVVCSSLKHNLCKLRKSMHKKEFLQDMQRLKLSH